MKKKMVLLAAFISTKALAGFEIKVEDEQGEIEIVVEKKEAPTAYEQKLHREFLENSMVGKVHIKEVRPKGFPFDELTEPFKSKVEDLEALDRVDAAIQHARSKLAAAIMDMEEDTIASEEEESLTSEEESLTSGYASDSEDAQEEIDASVLKKRLRRSDSIGDFEFNDSFYDELLEHKVRYKDQEEGYKGPGKKD